jgi:Lysyl oxidase
MRTYTAYTFSVAALVGALSFLGFGVSAARAAPVYPNLVSDAPEAPAIDDYTFPNGDRRLLLRFDGFVHNAGFGALELRGNPQTGRLTQRVFDSSPSGPFVDLAPAAPVLYETNDGHDHWHFMRASEYSLWNSARTAQVAPAEKVGFCLYDIDRVETHGPSGGVYNDPTFCGVSNSRLSSLRMGVSAGWRDVYGAYLALQWVDVSSTAPGRYALASRADPDNTVVEASESDNGYGFSSEAATVPGHRAEPVGPVSVPPTGSDVTLRATTFTSATATAGPRRFRITDPPDHGTLSQPTGVQFSGETLRYVPTSGYSGPDAFSYVALDAQSPFPLTPPAATASLQVTATGPGTPVTPAISISGAPAAMVVGTSVQLTATGAASGPVWSVDGVPGGSPRSGTITSGGLYVAPRDVPASGRVTVRAASSAGGQTPAQVVITIVPAPVQRPAPAPGGATVPTGSAGSEVSGRADIAIVPAPVQRPAPAPGGTSSVSVGSAGPAGSTRVGIRNGRIEVRVMARRTGAQRVGARVSGRTILSCTAFAVAGSTVTCRGPVRSNVRRSEVRPFSNLLPRRARTELGRVRLAVRDGMLVARVVPTRAGSVRVRIARNGAVLLRCRSRVPAGRIVTCSAPSAAAQDVGKGLKVTASLVSGARSVTVARNG